jgi:hypothetical protein
MSGSGIGDQGRPPQHKRVPRRCCHKAPAPAPRPPIRAAAMLKILIRYQRALGRVIRELEALLSR